MAQQGPMDAVQTAKNVLAGAKKFSKQVDPHGGDAMKPQQPVAQPAPKVKSPSLGNEAASAGAGLAAKAANVKQYEDATNTTLPKMHKGGTIPEDGAYNMKKGEEVIPAGRASEYRKVYLQRKSKEQHPAGA